MIHYSSFVIVNTFCLFKGAWRGILQHVINEHEWLLLSCDGVTCFCIHNNNNNTLFTKSNTAYMHIAIFAKLIKNQYIPRIELFNATFSNISAISWGPVLVVGEAGVPAENHSLKSICF
jgi:hypothetical protein